MWLKRASIHQQFDVTQNYAKHSFVDRPFFQNDRKDALALCGEKFHSMLRWEAKKVLFFSLVPVAATGFEARLSRRCRWNDDQFTSARHKSSQGVPERIDVERLAQFQTNGASFGRPAVNGYDIGGRGQEVD